MRPTHRFWASFAVFQQFVSVSSDFVQFHHHRRVIVIDALFRREVAFVILYESDRNWLLFIDVDLEKKLLAVGWLNWSVHWKVPINSVAHDHILKMFVQLFLTDSHLIFVLRPSPVKNEISVRTADRVLISLLRLQIENMPVLEVDQIVPRN